MPLGAALVVVASVVIVAGCSDASGLGPGSVAYEQGELGNGGFTFACDDAASCVATNSSDANAFPYGVAQGAEFRVRYVPNSDSTINIRVNDDTPSSSGSGSLSAVSTRFLTKSPRGFLAKEAGYGTITARNASGALMEFITLPIAPAAKLAVYEARSGGPALGQATVREVTLRVGETKSFKVLAQDSASRNLGGSFGTDIRSSAPAIVDLDSRDRTTITIVGLSAGTATVTVEGLGLSTTLSAKVEP